MEGTQRGYVYSKCHSSSARVSGASKFRFAMILVFHLGCNDLVSTSKKQMHNLVKGLLAFCTQSLPHTTLVWSFILPQFYYNYVDWQSGMVQKLREVNRNARNLFYRVGGKELLPMWILTGLIRPSTRKTSYI